MHMNQNKNEENDIKKVEKLSLMDTQKERKDIVYALMKEKFHWAEISFSKIQQANLQIHK